MTYAAELSNLPFTLTQPRVRRSWLPSPSASSITFISPWMPHRDGQTLVVQRAVWLHDALATLQSLGQLAHGWDGATASEIQRSLIDGVSGFLSSVVVSRLQEAPQIVPTTQGGLLIEWHTLHVDLLIESSPFEEPTFYYRDIDQQTEVEGSIVDHLHALQAAFAKLY